VLLICQVCFISVTVHDCLKVNLQVLHCDPEKASECAHQAFRFSLLKPVSAKSLAEYLGGRPIPPRRGTNQTGCRGCAFQFSKPRVQPPIHGANAVGLRSCFTTSLRTVRARLGLGSRSLMRSFGRFAGRNTPSGDVRPFSCFEERLTDVV
jgi:hypothetical protein